MMKIDDDSSHLSHTYYVPGTTPGFGNQAKKELLAPHHITNGDAYAQSSDIIKTTVVHTQSNNQAFLCPATFW